MAEFELSLFQKDILAFFKSHPHDNMFIEASAGSSKTFILVEMSKITTSSDVYIAFNSSIAEEVRSKIENQKVKVYTIHALALSIMNTNLKNHPTKKVEISSGIGTRRNNDSSGAKLDNFKIQTILDEMIDESEGSYCDYDQRIFLKDNYSTLYNLCRLTCTDLENPLYVGKLMQDYQLFETDKENIEVPNVFDICKNLKELDTLSAVMFDQTNVVDFTDMVYITYNKLKSGEWQVPYWHLYTNVYNDEAQDNSDLLTNFIPFIIRKGGRVVFVLDGRQSCYQFAGANSNSYKIIPEKFIPIEIFKLPICYRCPVSHLDYVKYKLPEIDIRPRPNAPEGEIDEIEKEEIVDYVQPGDMVISRKNKWLAPVILDLAKEGISICIQDKDFVNNVFKSLKRTNVKKLDTLQNKLTKSISNFKKNIKIAQELSNEFDHMSPEDKVKAQKEKVETILDSNTQIDVTNFILVILNNYIEDHPNGRVEDFERFLKHILNTTPKPDAVRICSIHKAKGLEADNVFVLNRGDWTERYGQTKEQLQQEKNLSYIAWTRAKDNLYLVGEPEAEEHDDNELPQDDGNFFFL